MPNFMSPLSRIAAAISPEEKKTQNYCFVDIKFRTPNIK
jgi:hypothetical protein